MTNPIWAPWRMEYILGKTKQGCIFCEFSVAPPERMRELLVLCVTDTALVCLNRFPFTTSHLLVAPRRHVSDLAELEDGEYAALSELIRATSIRLRRAVGCEGMNIGYNLGKVAGAGIADHLHAHLVPRWSGDSNFMPVIGDVRVMPEYLDEAWKRLLPHFNDIPGVHPPPHEPA